MRILTRHVENEARRKQNGVDVGADKMPEGNADAVSRRYSQLMSVITL